MNPLQFYSLYFKERLLDVFSKEAQKVPGPRWNRATKALFLKERLKIDLSLRYGHQWLREFQEKNHQDEFSLRDVSFQTIISGIVNAEWCIPKGERRKTVILYFHGGDYIYGSPALARNFIVPLAIGSKSRVLSLAYNRAPEANFPDAHEEALAAYQFLVTSGVEPLNIVMVGEGPGASMALGVLFKVRQQGTPAPKCAVLLSPWVNPMEQRNSKTTAAPYDIRNEAHLKNCFIRYAGSQFEENRVLSPIRADLNNLPHLFIAAGDTEILYPQIREFVKKAKLQGTKVQFDIYGSMFHGFYHWPKQLKDAHKAMDRICNFILSQ